MPSPMLPPSSPSETDLGLPGEAPSRTPTPPLLSIRLVSPPTPPSSRSFETLDAASSIPLAEAHARYANRSSAPHAAPSYSSSLRRSTLSFSALFSPMNQSELHTTHDEGASEPSRLLDPKKWTRGESKNKVRSPSLGRNHKSNIGMVKTALGLAKRVSMRFRRTQNPADRLNVRNIEGQQRSIATVAMTAGNPMPMRRVGQHEFPNVGFLSESRRARQGKTLNRASPLSRPVRTPSRTLPVLSKTSYRRRSSVSHLARTHYPLRLQQDVGAPDVSPLSRPAQIRKIIDRPRAAPRRRLATQHIPLHPEHEWQDESAEEDVEHKASARPPTRLSLLPLLDRLSFVPRPSNEDSTSSRRSSNSEASAFSCQVPLEALTSPRQSIGASEESFYCRGEVPLTPSDRHSSVFPTPARDRKSWFDSPRNAIYFPRTGSRRGSHTSHSLTSTNLRRALGRESMSPGDLTRFLDELVDEQAEQTKGVVNDNRDVFADADEGEVRSRVLVNRLERDEDCLRESEFEEATLRSTRGFTLCLPPRRRLSQTSVTASARSDFTRSSFYDNPGSPRIASSISSIDPFSLEIPPRSEANSASSSVSTDLSDEDRIEQVVARVLSASRQTFTPGPLVRTGSLTSLGVRVSPSNSISSGSGSGCSWDDPKSANSCTSPDSPLSSRPARPRVCASTIEPSPTVARQIVGASKWPIDILARTRLVRNFRLEESDTNSSPASVGGKFVTAPSTPFISTPAATSVSSTLEDTPSSTTRSKPRRTPLASILQSLTLDDQSDYSEPRTRTLTSTARVSKRGAIRRGIEGRAMVDSNRSMNRRKTMLPIEIYADLHAPEYQAQEQELGTDRPETFESR
ncbi:uncharacterized protein JCM15063_002525 [Sporobolomyces koalae]|uniref:uncharacterized protein n=1 Tax=Sporobolomyces koalae TaxID=500713 RepID=UPI003180DCFD